MYVDDTFVIQQAKHSQQLLQHINSQDLHIQFTIEELTQEGRSTFPGHFGFSRSQQHSSDHYLQKANTRIAATSSQQKISVFNTSSFRAKVVCTSEQALHNEIEHIKKPYRIAISHHGLSTLYKSNLTANMTSTMDNNHWQPTQQQQQWIKQQKYLHSCSIYPWAWGKDQKDMQQLGDPDAFQRE